MQLSWQRVQNKYNLYSVSFDKYFNNIGLPFNKILKKLSIHKNLDDIKKCYDNESIRNINKIKYFGSILQTLKLLKKRNYTLAIVTSKDIKRTRKFLKHNEKLFSFIECHNSKYKGKPHPDQINKIIELTKIERKYFVYIGDTNIDYKAAKAAKIDFIFAEWGYGNSYNYKYKLKTTKDILRNLKK